MPRKPSGRPVGRPASVDPRIPCHRLSLDVPVKVWDDLKLRTVPLGVSMRTFFLSMLEDFFKNPASTSSVLTTVVESKPGPKSCIEGDSSNEYAANKYTSISILSEICDTLNEFGSKSGLDITETVNCILQSFLLNRKYQDGSLRRPIETFNFNSTKIRTTEVIREDRSRGKKI